MSNPCFVPVFDIPIFFPCFWCVGGLRHFYEKSVKILIKTHTQANHSYSILSIVPLYFVCAFFVVCILLWCQHMFVMLNLHHIHATPWERIKESGLFGCQLWDICLLFSRSLNRIVIVWYLTVLETFRRIRPLQRMMSSMCWCCWLYFLLCSLSVRDVLFC